MREETNYRSYRDWLKKQMIQERQQKIINSKQRIKLMHRLNIKVGNRTKIDQQHKIRAVPMKVRETMREYKICQAFNIVL